MSMNEIMDPLAQTAKEFIAELLGLSCVAVKNTDMHMQNRLKLLRATSCINITGALTGKFIMSMDEKLLSSMVHHFVMEDLTDDEAASCMEDTLAECLNIIIGNSIKLFPGIEEQVTMDAPISLTSDNGLLKYSEQIWTVNISCECGGNASLSFVSLNH
jgi:two-component system chemotaxis sensor kinase CheA